MGDNRQKIGGFLTCITPLLPDAVDTIKTGLYIKENSKKLSLNEEQHACQHMEVASSRLATGSIGMALGMIVGGPPGAIFGAMIGRQFGDSLVKYHSKK